MPEKNLSPWGKPEKESLTRKIASGGGVEQVLDLCMTRSLLLRFPFPTWPRSEGVPLVSLSVSAKTRLREIFKFLLRIPRGCVMSGTRVKMAKSKQSDEVLDTICASLRLGIPFDRSCKAAGISKHSGHNWRRDGWQEIEEHDPDLDEPLGFTARFAIEVESALVTFMAPLVQRVRDAAAGKGAKRADWRAAQTLLASRFPDEWSERVAVAKSQRIEVAGNIGVNVHGFAEFVALRKMTRPELLAKNEQLNSQIDHRPLGGQDLDDEIEFLEAKICAMREARASNRGFTTSNWLVGRPAGRPIAIDLEGSEFTEAAPLAIGLEAASSGNDAVDLPDAAPQIARVQKGFGYDRDSGQAIPIYADAPVDDDLADIVAARSTPGSGGEGGFDRGPSSPFPTYDDDETTL